MIERGQVRASIKLMVDSGAHSDMVGDILLFESILDLTR